MPRIDHAGHGAWMKNTQDNAGTLAQPAKPSQGFPLELAFCLGLLVLGFGIRYVGHFVL